MARHVEEFDSINARTSKIKIIDSLVNAGLIEEESRGVYKKTVMGGRQHGRAYCNFLTLINQWLNKEEKYTSMFIKKLMLMKILTS